MLDESGDEARVFLPPFLTKNSIPVSIVSSEMVLMAITGGEKKELEC